MQKRILLFLIFISTTLTLLDAQTAFSCGGGSSNTYTLSGTIGFTSTPTGNGNCAVQWNIAYNMALTGTWWSAQAGMYCGGTQANFIHSAYPPNQSSTWNFTYENVDCSGTCQLKYYMNGPGGTFQGNCVSVALTALPIELEQFYAKSTDTQVQLNWSTASEKDNRGFEIERSAGISDWEVIGMVDGNGNTTEQSQYNFSDKNPLPGINYYRLKQLDEDGNFTYSFISFAEFRSEPVLLLAPNPATEFVVIYGGVQVEDLSIYNANGSLVKSASQPAENQVSIQDLPAGTYYLTATTAAKNYQFRFVKN